MQLRPSDATNLAGKTDEELGRRHLSHSRLSVLLACNRKYDLKYNHGLELIEIPRPLSLGKAFQKAIEHQDPETGVRALRGQETCPECGGEGSVEDPEHGDLIQCGTCMGDGWTVGNVDRMTQSQLERLVVDEAIVAGASKLYLSRWPGGTADTREWPFRIRLRNPETGAYSRTFDLMGYADGYDEDERELTENKLVGDVSPGKVQHLPLDQQVRIERYAIWRATAEAPVSVRYRWVKKPQIRQRKNETLEEFAERIRSDYGERPEHYLHEQEPQFAPTGDFLRMEYELWDMAYQLRRAERAPVFVRNTNACRPVGMSPCPYIPICTGDPDAMSLYTRQETTDA